jgi:hypothetical protein
VRTERPKRAAASAAPAREREDVMEIVSDLCLEGQVVPLDGRHFIGCTITNCTLQYSGAPVVIESTNFHGCRFEFLGQAGLTMRLLECFQLIPEDDAEYTVVSSSNSGGRLPN